MYTVLARKYRSQTFDDVVGQDPIAQTLKNAIKSGKIAHGFLFSGTRGVGKTTMARILAKSLNCLKVDEPTVKPCCKCESCVAINAGEDIDVIEIDGASNNGVEEVRRLRENAIYRPARSRYKIYIIDEVHMLSNAAFNALLKILEEPPSHVKFIFATTEPNKVLSTIQSRCQQFDFANISPQVISAQLEKVLKSEKIDFEPDVLLMVAKQANGSMRDALSLLDRLISTGETKLTLKLLEEFLGTPSMEKICELLTHIAESDAAATLQCVSELLNSGQGEIQIADALTDVMRDLMVLKSAGAETDLVLATTEQRKRFNELTEKFDTAALVHHITVLEKMRWSLKNTDAPRALLEASMLRFALAEHFMNVDALLSQTPQPAGGLKKNVSERPTAAKTAEKPALAQKTIDASDIESISQNWPTVIAQISEKLGKATTALIGSAKPVKFEKHILTLSFVPAEAMHKRMCEQNGRLQQIEKVICECLGQPIHLELVLEHAEDTESPIQKGSPTYRRNELLADPAVKTILAEFDATVTNIEEE